MLTEEFKQLLHNHGYKATPQRIAIYKVIKEKKSHPTAEEIYETVTKIFPGISKATVYKTLLLFKELEIIMELGNQLNNNSTRYETDTSPHLNLICNECGNVTDYDPNYVDKFFKSIRADLEVNIQPRFDVFYTCETCSEIKSK